MRKSGAPCDNAEQTRAVVYSLLAMRRALATGGAARFANAGAHRLALPNASAIDQAAFPPLDNAQRVWISM
jgi:hypothetical protein